MLLIHGAGRFQHLQSIRRGPEAERRREEERATPTSRRERIGREGRGGSEASSEERPIGGRRREAPISRNPIARRGKMKQTGSLPRGMTRKSKRQSVRKPEGNGGGGGERPGAVKCPRFEESNIPQKRERNMPKAIKTGGKQGLSLGEEKTDPCPEERRKRPYEKKMVKFRQERSRESITKNRSRMKGTYFGGFLPRGESGKDHLPPPQG